LNKRFTDPQEPTQSERIKCPLSSTATGVDECAKGDCAAHIENSKTCFYKLAANYGRNVFDDKDQRKPNIYYLHDFQAVYKEHYQSVFKIAYRMLKSYEVAEDIAQEVFVKAYKNTKTVGPDQQLSAWLYRVTTNLCLDELRRRKKHKIEPYLEFDIDEIQEKFRDCYQGDPATALKAKEEKAVIEMVLMNMPAHYCQALVMKCVDGLSYSDIACAMDTTIASVRSTIFRARKLFVKLYSELSSQNN